MLSLHNQDLRSELGLFRPSGEWYVKNTNGEDLVNGYPYGRAGDIPGMGDYDGDGEMDIALFRPSTGVWYARNPSGANIPRFPYCFRKSNSIPAIPPIPVPGDYDGDGRTDIAVFAPYFGVWSAKSYANGSWQNIPGFPYCFGKLGDIPVPAPYSFTGKTDIALWRPSTGNWYAKVYSSGAWSNVAGFPRTYGVSGDRPVPGDYHGDGVPDIGIYRASTGKWYAKTGSGNTIFPGVQLGAAGGSPPALPPCAPTGISSPCSSPDRKPTGKPPACATCASARN